MGNIQPLLTSLTKSNFCFTLPPDQCAAVMTAYLETRKPFDEIQPITAWKKAPSFHIWQQNNLLSRVFGLKWIILH